MEELTTLTSSYSKSVEEASSTHEQLYQKNASMRLRRFRSPSNKAQSRDDIETAPILREDKEEAETLDFEQNEITLEEPTSSMTNDSIILGEANESVEIPVSQDLVLSDGSLPSSTRANSNSFDRYSLSCISDDDDDVVPRVKCVSFSKPVVTHSWEIPRIEASDVNKLFYTRVDYHKFKQHRDVKYKYDEKFRDKEYCDRLCQNLEQMGAQNFYKGDFVKAIEAFRHSLRVKTETFTDCDIKSVAATIHCIADVYTKMAKWSQALDTYISALEMLSRIVDDEEDAREWSSVLLQKITTVQGYLGEIQEDSIVVI